MKHLNPLKSKVFFNTPRSARALELVLALRGEQAPRPRRAKVQETVAVLAALAVRPKLSTRALRQA